MKRLFSIIILALVSVFSAQGEAFAKKKVVEPVAVDSLTLLLQAGDSLMQQYNTFEALRYYQQAFAMKDTLESRTKLADCYYKRGNYLQTANLLKNVPGGDLTHEAFRQLALSYQKQGDIDSYIFWAGMLVGRYPMDGEIVAGLTLAYAQNDQPQNGIICGMKYCLKDSTNILVNRALADAWFMNRDFKAAVKIYNRLLQQGDSTFNTLYSAGMCYTRLDSLELAYQHLLPAFLLSQMQHAGCAYRLGVVCVDIGRLDEGIGYLNLATNLLLPDTTTMKAITLSQGEAHYLMGQYAQAVEAWKQHLAYNPTSIATHYNIANAIFYYLPDRKKAKTYYERFLELARKEPNPNAQLQEMMAKAEELLKHDFLKIRK
jgi:tetratricopeptide (TPR) repeat protein